MYAISYFLTFLPFFPGCLSIRDQDYSFLNLVSNFPNSFLLHVCIFSIIMLVLRLNFKFTLPFLFLMYLILLSMLSHAISIFFNFTLLIPAFFFLFPLVSFYASFCSSIKKMQFNLTPKIWKHGKGLMGYTVYARFHFTGTWGRV